MLLEYNVSDLPLAQRESLKVSNNKSNKEKNYYSIAICYSVEDITTLLNIIKYNTKDILDENTPLYPNEEFSKIYEKLKDNKKIFKSLKEKDNKSINYYYFFDIIFPKNIDDIIKNAQLSPIFKINEEQKRSSRKSSIDKDAFISALNLFSDLLMNIPEIEGIEIKNFQMFH